MGVLDRFLNAMKLNDNDGFDDDDFLDDEMDDFREEAPKKRFFKKQNEEDDLGDLDMVEKVPSGKEKSNGKIFPEIRKHFFSASVQYIICKDQQLR